MRKRLVLPFASHPQHNGLALSLLLVLFNSLLKTFSGAHKDRALLHVLISLLCDAEAVGVEGWQDHFPAGGGQGDARAAIKGADRQRLNICKRDRADCVIEKLCPTCVLRNTCLASCLASSRRRW